MSNTTARQLLPLLQPSQAQKHVTVNAAMTVLNVLVQTSAISRTLTAPPSGVLAGACYIVANGATGDWLGQDRTVAVYSGSFWDFYLPKTGWRVWLEAEATEAVFDGAVWTTSADRPERVAALGISATPDDTNRLTVSADATLLTNAGAGHQLKINRANVTNTASVLFQTGFSGRAEMGNVGSNDFVLKVSANGTTFLTGLTIEAATGRVLASNGINLVPGAGDPASPQNGDVWYNSTTNRLRARQGGRSIDLFDPLFSDAEFKLQDDLDPTKQALFQLSGLTTATTQTYTLPNASGTVALTSNSQTFANTQTFSGSVTLGTATGSQAYTLGSNATVSGSTKTISIGTTGLAGSTTAITVGPTAGSGTMAFNNGLTAITFPDSAFTLQDNVDATKQAKFELAGLTTATTRTLNLPDANGTLALNSLVSASTSGLAPASGGGTANFLRADGTWASPGSSVPYASLSGLPAAIDAIDGLTPVADTLAYYTGSITGALAPLTSFGRSLIDDADVNAARTTLERQDYPTRAGFVAWATGRTPTAGLVMRAASYAYRYTGAGTTISDLPGWVPYGTVTALHWGADTTGATSAVAAVSAMIDYVNSLGGGLAMMPAGTYLWPTSLTKQGLSKVILQGEGNATKILRTGNLATSSAIRFWGGSNNRIRRLLIDCAGYAGRGILLNERYSGVEDCDCNNCPDRPFGMNGGGNTTYGLDSLGRNSDDAGFTTPTFFPIGCYLENCRVTNAGATAFSQKQMPHSRIQRCFATTVYSEGITIDKSDYCVASGNMLVDCALTTGNAWPDLDAGTGFLPAGGGGVGAVGIDGSTGSRFVKNTIIGVNSDIPNRNNRLRVAISFVNNIQAANGCQVEGNYISDAKAGVWLKGTVSGATGNNFRHIIAGNVFDTVGTGAGTGIAQFGAVWIDAGCTDNMITGNTQIGGTPLITGASSANIIDQMAANTLKGNNTAGLTAGLELSGTQVTAMLDTVTSAAKGLAPASGGGTTNFLRADGTWASLTASWAGLTGKPTTVSGFGITDAVALSGAQTVAGAKTFTSPVILGAQASDPGSPANGTVWYNSTTNQLKAQTAGVAVAIDAQANIGWLTPITGEYMITTMGAGGATGTQAGSANRMELFPFTARADTAVTGLAVNVTTLVAAALGKIVVYDSDGTGRPNALVLETGDLDFSTLGVKTATVSVTLRQGKTYWLGLRHNSTATLSTWPLNATPDINGGAPTTTARKVVRRTLTYATAATSTWGWASSEINNNMATAIWLKV